MQIQLEEAEIAEAIRNYIRGQVPIVEGDEMPVVITAGRGSNGHTAVITIQPSTLIVQSPERPTDAFPTYDAANSAVIMSNVEANVAAEASQTPVETPVEEEESSVETAEETPEPVAETPETTDSAEAPWEEGETVGKTADVDPIDVPAEEPTPTTAIVEDDPTTERVQTTAAPKSIFADVEDERDVAPAPAPTTRKASSLFGTAPAAAPATVEDIPETAVKPKIKSIFDNL